MKYRCPRCKKIFTEKLDKCPKCGMKFKYDKKKVVVSTISPEEPLPPVVPETTKAVKDGTPYIQTINKDEEKKEAKIEKEPDCNDLIDPTQESYFDGKTIQLIGWTLLGGLVTFVTLGICYPIAMGWSYNWRIKHTVINGKRLRFTGVAGSLIPRWLLWLFLTLITIGIFALFIPVRLEKWKAARTAFVIE